jgi:hypothetical protein
MVRRRIVIDVTTLAFSLVKWSPHFVVVIIFATLTANPKANGEKEENSSPNDSVGPCRKGTGASARVTPTLHRLVAGGELQVLFLHVRHVKDTTIQIVEGATVHGFPEFRSRSSDGIGTNISVEIEPSTSIDDKAIPCRVVYFTHTRYYEN